MAKRFDNELDELKKKVTLMGQNAQKMLLDSITAMKNQDTKLGSQVIQEKATILGMEDKIEERALGLIAMFQPVADDMRTLTAAIKMVTYLQRIAQYGVELAQNAIELSSKPHIKKLVSIPYMSKVVGSMMEDALKGFESDSRAGFDTLFDRFKDIEELSQSIFRECVTYMMEDSKTIRQCSIYIMSSRCLGRCADYACKLAEAAIYMQSGERVEINCSESSSKACFMKAEAVA
jgi:phosphate transport system protein